MDIQAFNKIYAEAEEAIAEHRINDVLDLIEAIFQDTSHSDCTQEVMLLRERYSLILNAMTHNTLSDRDSLVNTLFRSTIGTLQQARSIWHIEHPETMYGRSLSQLLHLGKDAIIDQLQRTTRSAVGKNDYHVALDAAFGLLWCLRIESQDVHAIAEALAATDNFARRTLVGALLLGIIDCFSTEKLNLLMSLGKASKGDQSTDSADLQARIAVALTLIYQRYTPFFAFFTDEMKQMRTLLTQKNLRSQIPSLFHAFVCQTLVDRVDKRVDDILPIIKEAFEKQQRRLGSNDDDDKDKKKDPFSIDVQEFRLDGMEGDLFMDKIARHARDIDNLRQSGLDINANSFVHMKRFPFFNHPAHWFYPFSEDVEEVKQGLTRANGKRDRLTLSIMATSRFCNSDSYSYACMMLQLRNGKHHSSMDELQEQLEEFEDAINEYDSDDEPSTMKKGLDPFTAYCQDIHRFFYQPNIKEEPAFKPFSPNDRLQLPMLPLFEGLFNDEESLAPSIDSLIQMGDYERSVVLIDYVIEHFGANASMLFSRGFVLMQLQQWHRALDAFQQRLIIDDDPETSLYMARCFEALGQWDNALPLLQAEMQRCLDTNDNETANIIEETGRCLIQLRRWDDAVQLFFRLEFMNLHLNVVRRAIAWCSIHQGKYERAVQYYNALIDKKKATWEDHLNMGHALWLQGQTEEALAAYKKSLTLFNRCKKEQRAHFAHWTEAFQEDARDFLSKHFDKTDCALMMDAVTR